MIPSLVNRLLFGEMIGDFDDKTPVEVTPHSPHPCHPKLEWLKKTQIGHTVVSSIRINKFGKIPDYWETMVILRGKDYKKEYRSHSREDALRYHDKVVTQLIGLEGPPPPV